MSKPGRPKPRDNVSARAVRPIKPGYKPEAIHGGLSPQSEAPLALGPPAWQSAPMTDDLSPQALNGAGLKALAEGDFEAAIALLRRAIALDAKAPPLWLNLAKAYRLAGDDAGERAALDAALDIDRTTFMAWLRKAELHERRSETGPAADAWRSVIQLAAGAPDVPPALAETLAHGAHYLAAQNAALATSLDAGLAADRAAFDGSARRRFDALGSRWRKIAPALWFNLIDSGSKLSRARGSGQNNIAPVPNPAPISCAM